MVISWLKRLAQPQDDSPPPTPQPAPSTTTAEAAAATVAEAIAMSAEGEIPREKIAQRAYEKWVAKGRPVGTSHQDWLEAEAELKAELHARREPPPHRSR